jgi:hypothetical protein
MQTDLNSQPSHPHELISSPPPGGKWLRPVLLLISVTGVFWALQTDWSAGLSIEHAVMTLSFLLYVGILLWSPPRASEVYDCGDHLLIKIGNEEDRIMLANIIQLSEESENNDLITIKLDHSCRFGDTIIFFTPNQAFFKCFLSDREEHDRILRNLRHRSERLRAKHESI